MKTRMIRNAIINLMIAALVYLSAGCSPKRPKGEVTENLSYDARSFRPDSTFIAEQPLFVHDLILKLYIEGTAHPVPKWNSRSKIEQMITAIHNASLDGLNPDDYHLREIEYLNDKMALSMNVNSEDAARLELLLTDSFLLLAYHLSVGKTNPETMYPEWEISRKNVDINWDMLLDSVLNGNNIAEALQKLTPRHSDYYNLKKALAKYRLIEELGGWKDFESKTKLQKGDRCPDVILLRKRLAVTQGDIPFVEGDEDLFDEFLKDQVILFQKLNSLDPDGVVGKATIKELNIPLRDRILKLESNLERWRWISDDLGRRYIKVNIANFNLSLIENGNPVLQSAAVVGEPYKQTPVFSSVLKYLVLNPDWNIPPDILKKEIIPEIKKDPDYLVEKKMKVLRVDGTEVDNASINWNSVRADYFPYMIRQDPGPVNALGRIQFLFPNKYIVYIHDTPFKYLFSQNSRALSHGCIRINKAFELAEYLLKDQPEWDSQAIQKVIDQGAKRIIRLRTPVPVHILYLTAWADNDGRAYFVKDIYNRDSVLIKALDRVPILTSMK